MWFWSPLGLGNLYVRGHHSRSGRNQNKGGFAQRHLSNTYISPPIRDGFKFFSFDTLSYFRILGLKKETGG
jgi:hypothetical protein